MKNDNIPVDTNYRVVDWDTKEIIAGHKTLSAL